MGDTSSFGTFDESTIPTELTLKQRLSLFEDVVNSKKVSDDSAAITWGDIKGNNSAQNNVTENLSTLPLSGLNGSTIAWKSSDPYTISTNGVVVRPPAGYGDKDVSLIAKITCGNAVNEVLFAITVKNYGSGSNSYSGTTNYSYSQGSSSTSSKSIPSPSTEPSISPNEVWQNPFADVNSNDWFYDDVKFVHKNGLMYGTSDNIFSPGTSLTRGMLVAILGRLDGFDISNYQSCNFIDVDYEKYYSPYIEWARQSGIVFGIGDDMFNPDAPVTRQDLAVILMRYAEYAEFMLPAVRNYSEFKDYDNISIYARSAIASLYKADIINGKPGDIYDPLGNATRAEVAAMIHRLLDIVRK